MTNKEIIGYYLLIYCIVVGENASFGKQTYLDEVIDSLKKIKKWDARKSRYNNVFEIHFDINVDDKTIVDTSLTEASEIFLVLSLKNKNGFIIQHSLHPKFKEQPFGLYFGLQEAFTHGITEKDVQMIKKIYEKNDCLCAAIALQKIYSQATNSSKIMTCWAAIEELFSSTPEHVLNESEKKIIFDILDKLNFLKTNGIENNKMKKIKEVLGDTNLMAIKNRNERIAQNISKLMNTKYDDVLERIKKITKIRSKLVHNLSKDEEIKGHVLFIEKVLKTYINQMNNIMLLNVES